MKPNPKSIRKILRFKREKNTFPEKIERELITISNRIFEDISALSESSLTDNENFKSIEIPFESLFGKKIEVFYSRVRKQYRNEYISYRFSDGGVIADYFFAAKNSLVFDCLIDKFNIEFREQDDFSILHTHNLNIRDIRESFKKDFLDYCSFLFLISN